jgi:hypothetical protein
MAIALLTRRHGFAIVAALMAIATRRLSRAVFWYWFEAAEVSAMA